MGGNEDRWVVILSLYKIGKVVFAVLLFIDIGISIIGYELVLLLGYYVDI